MSHVLYFGCGTSQDLDLIVALFDRVPEHFNAKLDNFGLFLENWSDFPSGAREILKEFWPDLQFRSWLILPWPGAVVWGTAWLITEEEMEIMGEWELRNLWFTEGDVTIENKQGIQFPAKTERTYYNFTPHDKPANSLDFKIYPNPKEKMINTARNVRLGFLSEKHDYNAFKKDPLEFKKLLKKIQKNESHLWKINKRIIKFKTPIEEIIKHKNVDPETKVQLLKHLIPKLNKFFNESLEDLIILRNRIIALIALGTEVKKLKIIVKRLDQIIAIIAKEKNDPTLESLASSNNSKAFDLISSLFSKTSTIQSLISAEVSELNAIINFILKHIEKL